MIKKKKKKKIKKRPNESLAVREAHLTFWPEMTQKTLFFHTLFFFSYNFFFFKKALFFHIKYFFTFFYIRGGPMSTQAPHTATYKNYSWSLQRAGVKIFSSAPEWSPNLSSLLLPFLFPFSSFLPPFLTPYSLPFSSLILPTPLPHPILLSFSLLLGQTFHPSCFPSFPLILLGRASYPSQDGVKKCVNDLCKYFLKRVNFRLHVYDMFLIFTWFVHVFMWMFVYVLFLFMCNFYVFCYRI